MNLNLKKISLTKLQKKLAIQGGILAAVFLIFLVVVIMPLSQNLSRVRGEVEGRFGENQRVQNLILDSQRSAEKLQKILERLHEYHVMIPPREKLSEALEYIASQAQSNQLEVQSLQPLNDRPYMLAGGGKFFEGGREVRDVIVDLKARGQYLDFGRYVTALENMPFKVLIKNIELRSNATAKDGMAQASTLTAHMQMGILMMAPAEASS